MPRAKARSHGFVSENVVNLSNRVLTPDEIQVLSRGLNFRPTPKNIDKFQLKKDLDEFGRRIKLKYYFDKDQKSLVGKDRIKRFRKSKQRLINFNCLLSDQRFEYSITLLFLSHDKLPARAYICDFVCEPPAKIINFLKSQLFCKCTCVKILKQLFASGSVIIGEYSPRLGEYSPIITR